MYYVMRMFTGILSCLPPAMLEGLARLMAWAVFDLLRFRRRLILKNLELAFGDEKSFEERQRIGRQAVVNFSQTLLETLTSHRYPMLSASDIQGGEHLNAALAQGRGVFILCFHMGNWEALASYISLHFSPVYAPMKEVGSAGVNRFVEELRQRHGLEWIKREKRGDGFRGIREALKKGGIVGFMIDQARPGEPRLPFFGHPAKTNTSLAAIWRRMQAPILPIYIHRLSYGRHAITCEAPLELPMTASSADDILRHSQIFNDTVERIVRRYPEHYFWLHDRWK